MNDSITSSEILRVTADIVSAYISNTSHNIKKEEISDIMQNVHQGVMELMRLQIGPRRHGPLVPAVPIEESIKDDYVVCLEDGKKLQMLKRHLKTVYNMTVEQYKERWGLPMDYPVVAPNYAKRRSAIAKNTGLGMTGRRKRSESIKFMEQTQADGTSNMAMVSGRK